MTYKLRVSSKNQTVIPVQFLRSIGLQPNQTNDVVIYKDIDGRWIIATNNQLAQKFAGALKSKLSTKTKTKLAKMSAEEVWEAENNSIKEYFKTKYSQKV